MISQNTQSPQLPFVDSKQFLENIKIIQTSILDYIEGEDNEEENYTTMTQSLTVFNTTDNKPELKYLLYLLNVISENHYQTSNFYDKIEQIILFFRDTINQIYSNTEIFDFFRENKRVLLILLQNKILLLDNKIWYQMTSKKYANFHYDQYFEPEINEWINKSSNNESKIDNIHKHHKKYMKFLLLEEEEEEEEKIGKNDFNLNFEELRKIGKNESKLCELIRKDSIDEFIIYITQRCIKHTSKVDQSIFETNYQLNKTNPTLIEYAAFYGAIQIFKYLHLNGASLNETLLKYAIHSKNEEMIFYLQEIMMKIDQECLFESIKCHHIDIFNYIMNNNIVDVNKNDLIRSCLSYYNVICLPDDFAKYDENFVSACQYDYIQLAYQFLKMNPSLISLPKILYHVKEINNNEFLSYLLEQPGIKHDESCLRGCKELKSVKIFSSEESIGESAFNYCENLTNVLFEKPSCLTHIGKRSFYNCDKLPKISIPSSVKIIDEGAFCYTNGLEQVIFEMPCSLTSIMNDAFYTSGLIEVTIPSSVTFIGKRAFGDCKKIQKVTFEAPSNVTSIGERAFEECMSLTQFEIPPKVTVIEVGTFNSCSNLEKVTIYSSVTEIRERAFERCYSLKQIDLPSSVISIEKRAFNECTSLEIVNMISSITSIGKKAFSKCKSLISVKIPSSVKTIGELAFKECSSLQEVVFNSESSLTSIGSSCFENCIKLIQMTIPLHVEKIESYCFKTCSSLTKIVILSTSLELIDSGIFFNCSSLKEAVLPPSLKVISNLAFKNCTQLQKIEIPQNVTQVGFSAFENCASLKSITFPSTVQSIGYWNFNGCTSLKEITIPASVENNFSKIYPNIKVNKI